MKWFVETETGEFVSLRHVQRIYCIARAHTFCDAPGDDNLGYCVHGSMDAGDDYHIATFPTEDEARDYARKLVESCEGLEREGLMWRGKRY